MSGVVSVAGVDGYEVRGDPDVSADPTRREVRVQAEAESLRESIRRSHFHQFTSGESSGSYLSHTHDEDADGHVHPGRQAFPARADGGYFETSGPSLGRELPAPVAANAARALEMLIRRPKTPPDQVMRWRLRLFCGHVIERTAHVEHRTVHAAFMGSIACPDCGLDPATILAARPLGRVAEPSAPLPRHDRSRERASLERRLASAQARVDRLRSELEALPAE